MWTHFCHIALRTEPNFVLFLVRREKVALSFSLAKVHETDFFGLNTKLILMSLNSKKNDAKRPISLNQCDSYQYNLEFNSSNHLCFLPGWSSICEGHQQQLPSSADGVATTSVKNICMSANPSLLYSHTPGENGVKTPLVTCPIGLL